jgi:prephenate dehydrogenase (NADP+)
MVSMTDSKIHQLLAKELFKSVVPRVCELPTPEKHDIAMSHVQVLTHLGFHSMANEWLNDGIFLSPHHIWHNEKPSLDEMKVLMAMRLFSSDPHVSGEIAMFNKHAHGVVMHFSESVSSLFELANKKDRDGLASRVKAAKEFLLDGSIHPILPKELQPSRSRQRPNSHLGLLAMADCWHQLGVRRTNSLVHATPPFLFMLGMVEHLLRDDELLNESLDVAVTSPWSLAKDASFKESVELLSNAIDAEDIEMHSSLFRRDKSLIDTDLLAVGLNRSEEMIETLAHSQPLR